MSANGPELPPERPADLPADLPAEQRPDPSRHQSVAGLLRALTAPDDRLTVSLEAVLQMACAVCPSCVAISLTVDHQGQPVTVAAAVPTGHPFAPSLTVQLPRPGIDGAARQPARLVVFATDPVALGRLAVAVIALLEIDPGRITLATAAAVPATAIAGLVLAGQLADRAVVDRALGALLEQGWVPTEGRLELQRRADRTGASLAHTAATIVAVLPGPPSWRPT